jgi:hypothetical protein
MLSDAIAMAVEAHRGQVDKAGAPYILHPLRLMLQQRDMPRRIAAILHDVVEDGGVTLETITAEFGAEIAAAVDALTHRDGEPYDLFVTRCATDPIARDVKRADIEDNLDLSRLPEITEEDHARAEKYRKVLPLLG